MKCKDCNCEGGHVVGCMRESYKSEIDNMREAMGTLPSQAPQKTYGYKNSLDSLYVKMVEYPKNPYKAIVSMAAATWGDNETGSTGKWDKLTPENRYRIVLAVLTGNTLPQAAEAVQFTFEVNGSPRHTFDQHARVRLGTAFASIGTRDNNKLDADFLFYPDVRKRMDEDTQYRERVEQWIKMTKDLYEETISTGQGSWQSGRVFLPMSVNHSYVFTQNYLALRGQCARRLMACEESSIVALHIALRALVGRKFPLLSNYLRPACDGAKRCIYHEGPEGMTKYFSSLFACCGRWPTKEAYSEFNTTCSDYAELAKHGFVLPNPDEWIKYGENDFDKLSSYDKALFDEENSYSGAYFTTKKSIEEDKSIDIFDARK